VLHSKKVFSPIGNSGIIGAFIMLVMFSVTLVSYRCSDSKSQTQLGNDSFLRFGFWNLENLFDTENDPTQDDEFTPNGANHWTKERYKNKILNLAKVIAAINPDLFGVCEVENKQVLDDLINSGDLKNQGYGIVHYNSMDERGIDVGFIYKKSVATVLSSEKIEVKLADNDKTRDELYVQIKLLKTGDTLHYFVNHWPSRREGTRESAVKRAAAATALKQFIVGNGLALKSKIICGDFNDNPWDSALKYVLETCRPGKSAVCNLYNLALFINTKAEGSLKFKGRWDIFDQIIISSNLWSSTSMPRVHFENYSFKIFAPDWLKETEGRQKGSPKRTFNGHEYLNGFSDHFPIYAQLKYE
jgi:predicted extracellular nuclease